MKSLFLRLVLTALALLAGAPVHAARFGMLEVKQGEQAPARADVLAGIHDARFVPFDGSEDAPPRDRREAWIRIEPQPGDTGSPYVLAVRRVEI